VHVSRHVAVNDKLLASERLCLAEHDHLHPDILYARNPTQHHLRPRHLVNCRITGNLVTLIKLHS